MASELEKLLSGVDDEIDAEDAPTEPTPAVPAPEPMKAASTYELVRNLYKNEYGDPFEMTPGQNEIFDCIFMKGSNVGKSRIHVMTFTQYGKSDTISMAILTRASTFPEKWAIVAPSQAKAKIIMGYIIKHLFENEYTLARFKVEEGENTEMIRRERSKNRLTFDIGNNQIGEIFILSAESRLKRGEDMGNALMGFGSPNLVEDEAALISDESDAKAMRMVGGFSGFGTDFVVKIGNPFTRGHFLKAYEDPAYHKINIHYKVGIKEGRLTQKFIEEMRTKPFFSVLYDNVFPMDGDLGKGWTQLLSEQDIESACSVAEGATVPQHVGEKRLGNDVARGGANFTAWCLRSMAYAEILSKSREDNLTLVAGQTLFFMKEHEVKEENVFIDDVGVGGGAVDPLLAEQKKVRGVNVGTPAIEDTRFANLRAEAYWRLREWVKKGGKLCPCHKDDWFQLTLVPYKPDSKGRLRVMSKDDMRAIGIESPDIADALMLTFVRREHADMAARKRLREQKKKARQRGAGGGLSLTMAGH